MGFLSFLLSLFNPLERIGTKLIEAKIASTNATTDQARIAAEERVKHLEMRRDTLVAEAGSPWNQFVRAGLSIPFMIYLWKLVVWDKVIMGGRVATDDLSNNLWWIMMTVIGFYFVTDVTKVASRYMKK